MLGTDLGPWYVFRVSRGPRNAPQKDIVFARCSPFASQGKGMRAEEHGGDNLVLGGLSSHVGGEGLTETWGPCITSFRAPLGIQRPIPFHAPAWVLLRKEGLFGFLGFHS